MVAFCFLQRPSMCKLTENNFKFLFYSYIATILLLLVLPLNGTINLTNVYFGFRSDHIVHCLLFTPFISLCYLSVTTQKTGKLLVYGYVFAAFCETLHIFIPYRNASIFDFFANCIGISVGYLVFFVFLKWKVFSRFQA